MIDYEVIYAHPALDEYELDHYLTDSVRSEAMLALEPQLQMETTFYRGTTHDRPEPDDLVSSWCINQRDASHHLGVIRTCNGLGVLAIVHWPSESDEYGMVEYIGRRLRPEVVSI